MTRKEFIKICGLLGVVIPFQASCVSSNLLNLISSKFTGKVIIIGAGAGGLSAGYLLNQLGVDFEILEASSEFGGRMKINTDFADFPIPLGAEWIETKIEIFSEILNDDSVQLDIKTIKYSPDYKFVNSSWFNFYGKYIVPSISDKIVFNSVVNSINYSGAKIGPKWKPGFTKAIQYWVPSIAASAITIYKGNEFNEWNGEALITSLKDKSMRRLNFQNLSKIEETIIFKDKIGRIRDIQVHPVNGKIYFLAGNSLWVMEKTNN